MPVVGKVILLVTENSNKHDRHAVSLAIHYGKEKAEIGLEVPCVSFPFVSAKHVPTLSLGQLATLVLTWLAELASNLGDKHLFET